jgi:hypothetical protein
MIGDDEAQRLLEWEAAQLIEDDDRPPICPACGVTKGIVTGDDGTSSHVCLEYGFSDERGTKMERSGGD